MKTKEQEVLLYYDPTTSVGKKTRAFAHSLANHVKDVEFHKTKFTTTMWRQVLNMLKLEPKRLLDKSHPYYQEHIRGRNFDEEGWLNILSNNPDIIRSPIVIKGSKAVLCDNPTDIYRLLGKEEDIH